MTCQFLHLHLFVQEQLTTISRIYSSTCFRVKWFYSDAAFCAIFDHCKGWLFDILLWVNNSLLCLRVSLILRRRHNVRDGVSNHQPHDCLLSRLFRRRSKKTSKLRGTGICARNSPGTGEFPAQMASNSENVSISWCHHGKQHHHNHHHNPILAIIIGNADDHHH